MNGYLELFEINYNNSIETLSSNDEVVISQKQSDPEETSEDSYLPAYFLP